MGASGPYDGVVVMRVGGASSALAPVPGGPLFEDGSVYFAGVEA
jgi:hypothetical protein